MDESDLEGTLVLERMAETKMLDAFFEAIDADDFGRVKSLLIKAGVDAKTIAIVLKMMGQGDG